MTIQLYESTLTKHDYQILSKKKKIIYIYIYIYTDFNTNPIDLNYKKSNKYFFFNINSELSSNCITNNHSKLKHISIS